MSTQIEVQREHRLQQQKFIYYLIALSVTAIGFSIISTRGETLKYIQIPLLISVISWSISIFLGLSFLRSSIDILYGNNLFLDIEKGNIQEFDNPQKQEYASKTVQGMLEKKIIGYEYHLMW